MLACNTVVAYGDVPLPFAYLNRLKVSPDKCVVIEDSLIGLQAALDAGMKCVITHTPSTKDQDFKGAHAVFPELGEGNNAVTAKQLAEIVL